MKNLIFFIAVFSSVALTAQVQEAKDVSYAVIEKAPTYPGCDNGDKKCFQAKLQEEITKNFNSKITSSLSSKQQVVVQFTITADGDFTDVKVKALNNDIKEEVIRIFSLLPKVTPGTMKGESKAVTYTLPLYVEPAKKKTSNTLVAPSQTQNN
ncbi:TonB C-terminal domain-containing protein [Nonlabens ulvanivorans]|uniref:TonB C-terminal domain-containing protein n=1 Tax=Nonlabens ulvanivorans TaxID=906888 RepID=UPI002941DD09|nr:energy transducer TonB [Nonlabens ulvanivorans]WOI23417.1 TonB C-terminal domain-containing protein [Nonlabens ulvanivorans]